MTDYLQKLIGRLSQPAANLPPHASITPFIPAFEPKDDAQKELDEVFDVPPEGFDSFSPAPDKRLFDQTLSAAGGSESAESVMRSVESIPSAPQRARMAADSTSTAASVEADVSYLPISRMARDKPPEVEPNHFVESQHPPHFVQTNDTAGSTVMPDSGFSPSHPPSNDLSASLRNAENRQIQEAHKLPPAIKRQSPALSPDSQPTPIKALEQQIRQPGKEHPSSSPKLINQAEPLPSAPDRTHMPTLRPAADPLPPRAPQPEKPHLVIGRLSVEILPPAKTSTPPASRPRPARRLPSTTASQTPARSKLRFGLGQL